MTLNDNVVFTYCIKIGVLATSAAAVAVVYKCVIKPWISPLNQVEYLINIDLSSNSQYLLVYQMVMITIQQENKIFKCQINVQCGQRHLQTTGCTQCTQSVVQLYIIQLQSISINSVKRLLLLLVPCYLLLQYCVQQVLLFYNLLLVNITGFTLHVHENRVNKLDSRISSSYFDLRRLGYEVGK